MPRNAMLLGLMLTSGWIHGAEPRHDARIFRGKNLDAVAMPVGGIGTGSVWVTGDGRLGVWQVFNNYDELPLPDTFLAVRAGAQMRVLQRADGWGLKGFEDVSCLTEYPFLTTTFRDAGLPVKVEMESFNPLIPTSTKDSSIPCAIFRLTATNSGKEAVDASFLFALQNPVGYTGGAVLEGRSYAGFGANRNVYEKAPGAGVLSLGIGDRKGSRFGKSTALCVHGRSDRAVLHSLGVRAFPPPQRGAIPPFDAVWLEGLSGGERSRVWEILVAAARDGKVALISGADLSFYQEIQAAQDGEKKAYEFEVFEDFESGSYERWTIEGTAFGKEPHTGTSPSQQPVSGFSGKRLVNTFVPNDGPQGRAVSKPFTISKRYIGFLIGGGGHAGRTCMNLLVDGKAVRTRAGRDLELLDAASWDVGDLAGKKAALEIVDRESGAWGHINVDQIIFSDTPPELILAGAKGVKDIVPYVKFKIDGAWAGQVTGEVSSPFPGVTGAWSPRDAVSVSGQGEERFDVLAEEGGRPLIVSGPFGKGRIVVALAKGLPASWGMSLLAKALGTTYEHGEGIDPESPLYGGLTLAALTSGGGGEPTACARWAGAKDLWKDFGATGRLGGPIDSGLSPQGETFNGALAVPLRLEAGKSSTATFILTWHFPNVERWGHQGNKYADWFQDSGAVSKYVRENFERLLADTRLFHETVYASNLPYPLLDAFTSQLAILRGPTCFWSRTHKVTQKDYFAGYEGCYKCCPLNCTHVWNYAQTHARLFPEIGRNLRWYDFMHYIKESGETQHRQHTPHGAFIDGHCAVIEGAYREYLMSPDASFLKEIYPAVKKAVEWVIATIDPDEDGVNGGQQWNTYDVATDGAHTFIGSQYLSALAAGERMALAQGDAGAAARWAKIRKAGSANQDKKLWNGEYWIQVPEPKPARDYNTGCHSDQLLGQWWAHMLDTGYLYPRDHILTALRSIFRHNFKKDFHGFVQSPRRYVIDEESGLVMCTWPKGGRPDPFILYADEVWTGIEYEVAGLMIYEGLVDEGLAIVKAARDRYDGRVRDGLNSGPGGNPFNELECGKFYARALSSGGLLLACQGFVYEGPKGVLGFRPRWKPDDHASFFSCAEGWGFFTQKGEGRSRKETIECRWGKIPVKELVFKAPDGWKPARVTFKGSELRAEARSAEDGDVRIQLGSAIALEAGDSIVVELGGR